MRETLARWAPLPLRLMFGIAFIVHGWPKVFSGGYHANFVGQLAGSGVPVPAVAAWVVALVEFLGGLALVLGIVTTLASALLVIDMVVALFLVHLSAGFSFIHIVGMGPDGPQFGLPGYEVNLIYIAGLLSLILSGPGRLAAGGRGRGKEPAPVEPH